MEKEVFKKTGKSIHTADFFEDFEDDYRKPELKIERHFKNAVTELLDILDHVEFKSQVFYVDLQKLRKLLGVKDTPKFQEIFSKKEEKQEYNKKRKIFENYLFTVHEGNMISRICYLYLKHLNITIKN